MQTEVLWAKMNYICGAGVEFRSRTTHEKSDSLLGHGGGLQEELKSKLKALPLSEIDALSKQNRICASSGVTSTKCTAKTRVRKNLMVSLQTKDRKRSHYIPTTSVAQVPLPVECNTPLVREAVELAISKGLHNGYVEYLRLNTDENIRRSFEEVKKELTNKQSFHKASNSVVRYLQAARILYNRLDRRERRMYEYAARNRVRIEHSTQQRNQIEVSAEACVMPRSEYVFMDRRSKEDVISTSLNFERMGEQICLRSAIMYKAFLTRRIHCPLCSINMEKLANALQYQLHMMGYHSCVHLYACHFCGLVFPSLEALKTHDSCGDFAAALFHHVISSGEVELTMKCATMIMVCTDCGLQLPISSSFIGESSVKHWDEIIEFHMLHSAEKLVPLVIYSEKELLHKVQLQIRAMTFVVKDVEIICPYCGIDDFESIDSLEFHFLSHEECSRRSCPECSKQFSQKAFYREHLLSHLEEESCYLAVHLSNFCTFITGGLPSCGPNFHFASSDVIYGGVSSTTFVSRLGKTFVDPWDSVTHRKEMNRRNRKRKLGLTYEKDPDEIEVDSSNFENCAILRKFLGNSFDRDAIFKTNGFFYTEISSKDETDYSSKLYNSFEMESESVLRAYEFGGSSKLAVDISQKFTRTCKLFVKRAFSEKPIPTLTGLESKVLMCRRCQCLCVGESSMYSHLLRCCPELRKDDDPSVPYDLEDGLLVLCVFAGNIVPNSRIKCWECASTLCSIFGLRVHMVIHHGTYLRVEGVSKLRGFSNERTAFLTSTTRSINLAIGLTADGSLPVNVEEKRKDALLAKLKLNEGIPSTLSPSKSHAPSLPLSKDSNCDTVLESLSTNNIHCISSSSVQVPGYLEPPSVQIVENVYEFSPDFATSPVVSTDSVNEDVANSHVHHDVAIMEIDLADNTDGFTELTSATSSEGQATHHISPDLDDGTTAIQSSKPCHSKEPMECEFCCLTLCSHEALKEHWKLHIEIQTSCHLCNPPCILDTVEKLLGHIYTAHTSETDLGRKNNDESVKCNFCDFSVQKGRIIAHLLSDCYMAPCLLCDSKLGRRNERISHKKSHRNIMNSLSNDHIRVKKKHTTDIYCSSCKTEPLVALREHVLIHLKELSEVLTPKPVLLRCRQPELLKNTLEEHSTLNSIKSRNKRKSKGDRDLSELTVASDCNINSSLLEDEAVSSGIAKTNVLSCDEVTRKECTDPQSGASPSVLEKQQQVLGSLISDFEPPPSIIILEHETAIVREERDGTPSAVPNSAVVDDGEDDILIVEEMTHALSCSPPVVPPVTHAINEGDDDCMMLDVIESTPGNESRGIVFTRERKFKCSMCSETFLRESTCRYHEQTSHRSDVGLDLCNEIYGVPLSEDSTVYICQQCVVAFEDPQRARRHLAKHMIKGPAL
ncbi:zinc finger, C2H2 type [Dictyocaulus viviparus]|uniref:Zinc finger, C2H2 type n=1 Tax=Dictyocaulus viviparus TaxID=29172 RepID=A0A0D8XJ91_DICVI|nr:zinc finger, C2H2 type [Dictyocaulus viviparus]